MVTSPGMSMDSTPFSRTRRAISCVYCSGERSKQAGIETAPGAKR